jgi:hypothetical protein
VYMYCVCIGTLHTSYLKCERPRELFSAFTGVFRHLGGWRGLCGVLDRNSTLRVAGREPPTLGVVFLFAPIELGGDTILLHKRFGPISQMS